MFEVTSILRVLSISAIITTISMFFCGIPICMEIWKRKGTNEISGVPFVMGLLGACFWLRYGFLKSDVTMITVNVVGVGLFTIYALFYLFMSKPKTTFGITLLCVLSTVFTMVLLVFLYEENAADLLGIGCMTFNIITFGAPLAGLRVVLRKRSCDTLPLPMCVANLLVSSQWFVYGTLIQDIYVMAPNSCGIVLALLQLSLFLIFPMRENGIAPIKRLSMAIFERTEDVEKGADLPTSPRHRHSVIDVLRKISKQGESDVPLINSSSIDPFGISCSNERVQNTKGADSERHERYNRSASFDTNSTTTTGVEISTQQSAISSQRDLNSFSRRSSAPQLEEWNDSSKQNNVFSF